MNIKVIINSAAARKKHRLIESTILKKLNRHNIDIEHTGYPGHAVEISGVAGNDNFDTIVAVGGDGTINEIINGMHGSNIALGIIPSGTANDLASYLNIPRNIERACDLINIGKTCRYDLIRVNDWHYITSGGIGLPCDVLKYLDRSRNRRLSGNRSETALGSYLYAWMLAKVLFKGGHRANRIRLQINGHRYDSILSSLTIGNQPFLGVNFKVLPGAVNSDGYFDLCLIEHTGSLYCLVMTLLKILKGKHIARKDVKMFRASHISVEAAHPIDFFGDGELKLQDTNFDIEIIPQAIEIISPDDR